MPVAPHYSERLTVHALKLLAKSSFCLGLEHHRGCLWLVARAGKAVLRDLSASQVHLEDVHKRDRQTDTKTLRAASVISGDAELGQGI